MFYNKHQVDDKIAWGLGEGFQVFIQVLSANTREKEHFLEIFKIQIDDDIIQPWVADGVPMDWWVSMS